ncbi:acetyltransferase [Oceanobacillus sp. M65]|uniref:acetyltransferase n=1 Tax=Oceanobacillus sp. M65 TaxID=3457435 RepID=UPI003FCD8A37
MNNKNKLLIIGASGHGKVIADIALRMNRWNEIAFLDDNESKKEIMELHVIGRFADISSHIDNYQMIVAIGNNEVREQIFGHLEELGASIARLIHPNATIGSEVTIGMGSVIMAGAVVNSCTEIGKGCIINTGATVDHDNLIGDFVHISPGAHLAGTVHVGKASWVGIGSVISNNLNLVSHCVVGAGSVVIKDLKESGTYIGVPAERIKAD